MRRHGIQGSDVNVELPGGAAWPDGAAWLDSTDFAASDTRPSCLGFPLDHAKVLPGFLSCVSYLLGVGKVIVLAAWYT